VPIIKDFLNGVNRGLGYRLLVDKLKGSRSNGKIIMKGKNVYFYGKKR